MKILNLRATYKKHRFAQSGTILFAPLVAGLKPYVLSLVLSAGYVMSGHALAASPIEPMCDKMKTCATEHLKKQDNYEALKSMITPMLEQACDTFKEHYSTQIEANDLQKEAKACMDSMLVLSCAEMEAAKQSDNKTLTPQCDVYEKVAKEKGVDVRPALN